MRTSCVRDQIESASCEGALVDAFENEAHIPVDNTAAIHLINNAKNRASHDKESWKRNGRIFLQE